MAKKSYSGPTQLFNGIPVKTLRFFQLGEQEDVSMGEMKMMVDDVKTVITYFINLYNNLPSLNGETFQLNGVDVGTSLTLDFVDSVDITWAVTYDPVTKTTSVSGATSGGGGGTPSGSNTEIQYNNAGAFGADSGFTRTAVKVTIAGDGTGTDGVLHVTNGDTESQYIVLEEESGRPGYAYLAFKGTTTDTVAMGVLFSSGVPSQYVFQDILGAALISININTGAVYVKSLAGVGTRMVTADAAGILGATALPSPVTSAALTKSDDTNVTATLTGTPSSALLAAVNIALGWAGQLSISRGGTGLSALGAALQQIRVNAGGSALEYFTPKAQAFTIKASDQDTAVTTNAMTDIADMSVLIGANETIYFDCQIHVGASATNGARYAITIPSGATMKVFHSGTASATIALAASQIIDTSGVEGSTTNFIANANQLVRFKGWVTTSGTAGTIQIRGRSISAANTVTWYAGSFINSRVI